MKRQIVGLRMPSTKLPPEHHLVRNVPWARLRKDDSDPERVVGVLGDAFKLRDADDGELSSTWVEYFAGSPVEKIESAVKAMRASKLEIRAKSGFVIGKVQAIAKLANDKGYKIRVLHEPEDDNKAHVSIRRWPNEDMEFFELLAAEAWSQLIMNSDIPPGELAAPDQSDYQLLQVDS
jgi:hypothetical protein